MADSTVETTNAKPQEDWMARRWRPMMGWMYMVVCMCDFVVFPVAWSLLQAVLKQPVTQWSPLTLQGAGLFHMAMGAVLGVAAYGRTQEKLGGANNGGIQLPQSTTTSTFGTSTPTAGSNFGSPAPTGGFGSAAAVSNPAPSSSNTSSFGSAFSSTSSDVTTGFGGKKAPPPVTDFPER